MIGLLWVGSGYRDKRGSWKFCHRGSNFNSVFFLDEEIEDPNTTTCNRGPSSARQRNVSLLCGWWSNMDAGFEALWFFQGIWTCSAKKPYIFVISQGVRTPATPPPWIRAWGTDNRGSLGGTCNRSLLASVDFYCNKLNYQCAVKWNIGWFLWNKIPADTLCIQVCFCMLVHVISFYFVNCVIIIGYANCHLVVVSLVFRFRSCHFSVFKRQN